MEDAAKLRRQIVGDEIPERNDELRRAGTCLRSGSALAGAVHCVPYNPRSDLQRLHQPLEVWPKTPVTKRVYVSETRVVGLRGPVGLMRVSIRRIVDTTPSERAENMDRLCDTPSPNSHLARHQRQIRNGSSHQQLEQRLDASSRVVRQI